jgi:hypothetical protein
LHSKIVDLTSPDVGEKTWSTNISLKRRGAFRSRLKKDLALVRSVSLRLFGGLSAVKLGLEADGARLPLDLSAHAAASSFGSRITLYRRPQR